MQVTSPTFKDNARQALADAQLQQALRNVRSGFIDKRRIAAEALPEFDALRDSARAIKDHALQNLDLYLEAWEAKVLSLSDEPLNQVSAVSLPPSRELMSSTDESRLPYSGGKPPL